mmetsp:Transcript_2798/g.5864  ORF Transcript_2798/g.5864 Transcript_2798/m.5864 type:complete len:210 (+) Transcript_2798:2984-3613(+)
MATSAAARHPICSIGRRQEGVDVEKVVEVSAAEIIGLLHLRGDQVLLVAAHGVRHEHEEGVPDHVSVHVLVGDTVGGQPLLNVRGRGELEGGVVVDEPVSSPGDHPHALELVLELPLEGHHREGGEGLVGLRPEVAASELAEASGPGNRAHVQVHHVHSLLKAQVRKELCHVDALALFAPLHLCVLPPPLVLNQVHSQHEAAGVVEAGR